MSYNKSRSAAENSSRSEKESLIGNHGVCAKKDDIKELAVGADVRSDDALSIRGRNVEGSKSDVIEWIDQLNY